MLSCNTLITYYLDWNNNNNTTEANVNKVFDASRHEITRSYRELVAQYHPDRGGDTETFIHIRQAYELLR